MSARPRLLDLFCGAGGAAMGYHRAGFDVIGVDIEPQPNYPFEFHRANAVHILEATQRFRCVTEGPLGVFDAIHASPPCQDYSLAIRHLAHWKPRLIDTIRERLEAIGLPWVIENVVGAPLPTQDDLFGAYGAELCGTMFGLRVRRHRLFECSFPVVAPRGCDHTAPSVNPYNAGSRKRLGIRFGRDQAFAEAMGIDWMTRDGLMEAIPPAYTEHIGRVMLDQVALIP